MNFLYSSTGSFPVLRANFMGQGCCDLVWKAFLFLVLLCWSWYFSWLLHSLAYMRLLTRHLMSFRIKHLSSSFFICSSLIHSFFFCSFLQLFLLQPFLHSTFFPSDDRFPPSADLPSNISHLVVTSSSRTPSTFPPTYILPLALPPFPPLIIPPKAIPPSSLPPWVILSSLLPILLLPLLLPLFPL